MNGRSLLFGLALLAGSGSAAFAHGTSHHLMGTAEVVSPDRLVVEDESGGKHDVDLGPKTKFRGTTGRAAKASDLRKGDRIVVHFGKGGAKEPAVEVRFNHSSP